MRIQRITLGQSLPEGLEGAILARDLILDGERWSKGRRLSPDDLTRLATVRGARRPGASGAASTPEERAAPADGTVRSVTVLVPDPDDVHEDDAARQLAALVAGPGLEPRGPHESRVDLHATVDGVVHVRLPLLQRLNRIDPVEVFTVFDGQVVAPGELVASVKVAPHLVRREVLERAAHIAPRPVVAVAPLRSRRIAVLVKETAAPAARDRFEASIRLRVAGLGSTLVGVEYVADDPAAVAAAFRRLRRVPIRADLILTAGAGSTDPADAILVGLAEAGGRMVRRGVPAHPGSMLWLARLGRIPVLGLPTCGAYSRATAVDLLLPRLLSGEPATAATVARLGHGGVLGREMRFRFPPYARRHLEAPEG